MFYKTPYPIVVGEAIYTNLELLQKYICGKQVMVVTNNVVAESYLTPLLSVLQSYQVDHVVLPDGESTKTIETLSHIYDVLLTLGHHRSTTIIALGGGVITDMAGFAAATYQRGVNLIHIPTTLLAQVDAAIGGKTGVNHALGKNMIGAFYQPSCVISDIACLKTLPEREFKAGLAEIIKVALIKDADFFLWIEKHMSSLVARDKTALIHVIETSARLKSEIVSQDEKERGVRMLLNFGHTFGHAIETLTAYKTYLHGEAVAIGMCMAARLSEAKGLIDADTFHRIVSLIKQAGLPAECVHEYDEAALYQAMARDKKADVDKLRLVLLKSIGQGELFDHHFR